MAARNSSLSDLNIVQRLFKLWMATPVSLALSTAFNGLAISSEMLLPAASGALLDILSTHRGPSPWPAWQVFAAASVGTVVFRNLGRRAWYKVSVRLMRQTADQGFSSVLSFDLPWHQARHSGATTQDIMRAMTGADMASDALLNMLGPSLLVLLGLCAMVSLRSPLAGVATAITLTVIFSSQVFLTGRYVSPASRQATEEDARLSAALADALGGISTIKAAAAETREGRRMEDFTDAWESKSFRAWLRFCDVGLAQTSLLSLLQALLTGAMVAAWSMGRASPGDVAFAIAASFLMTGHLRSIVDSAAILQRGLEHYRSLVEYISEAERLDVGDSHGPFAPGPGEIVFENVHFAYEPGRPVYSGLTIRISAGEKVALVGPTGAGKSTLLWLILGLYRPQTGRILIDGRDVASMPVVSLRQAVAFVPQNATLFDRTIFENIAYAHPSANNLDVAAAAARAAVHDFVTSLPKGYGTRVGEGGKTLSGGERQRVAIARASMFDANILLLDEPTSSLDLETEAKVIEALDELSKGKTTIIIAHRLSTIRSADRVLVLEGGCIREDGSYKQLLEDERSQGAFKRLAAQVQGLG